MALQDGVFPEDNGTVAGGLHYISLLGPDEHVADIGDTESSASLSDMIWGVHHSRSRNSGGARLRDGIVIS